MTNETALTISEQSQLSELEDIIDRGLQTFYEVGKALTIIRDEKLYRAGYATFEDYCEEKWQMSRAYAYRTIGAADVVKSLSPIGDIPLPRNEAQARPLTSLEPEQRQQAWTKAVEESGGQPTAKQVRRAADTVSGAVYESIHSLQSAVLAFHKRVCVSNKDMIASLEMLKNDHKSAGWGPLSLALSRDGKIFRVSDLRQAVNNALDSLQQTERAAADGNNLVDLVIEYATGYKDRFGRDWTQVENPAHTNGTFWDLIKAQSYLKKAYRNDAELKIAIKKAFARMKGEPEPDLSYWTKFVPTDEPEPVAAADEPYFPTLPKAAPQPPGEKNTVEARLFSALHCYDDSAQRWQEHRDKGLTNDEMRAAIGREFGDGHGASGPGLVPFYAKGRANPQFWHNAHGSTAEKPTLQGVSLIDLAREVLRIPYPQPATEPVAADVLNEEQPKPRIASFVMGYFQAANEAIARITTAIPKSRTDDIHDMIAILDSLERMERRIGAEYDMS